MKYIQLIDQARAHGVATEKKMMEAMEQLSCDLACMEGKQPDVECCVLPYAHAVCYGGDVITARKWPTMMSAILCIARKARMANW